jgi:hypothetical protein
MSSCSDPNPLRRDGLSQSQRRLPALAPSSIRLDERTGADLLAFATAYARKLTFYPSDGGAGDPQAWEYLMTPPDGQTLAQLEARADNPPHLALFLAFLKLFGLAQDQLNTFTQRHLDFYYRDVLRLHGRPAVPDQVHLTFELARNVAEQVLPAGTEFEAGRDAARQPLLYRTAAARVVNRAGLVHLRSLYTDAATAQPAALYFAPNSAAADGVAAALPADSPSWNPFGPPPAAQWPEALVGFALAAPVLLMAEGTRQVTVTLKPRQAVALPQPTIPLRVQLSGPTAWLEATSSGLRLDTKGNYVFTATLPATEKLGVVGYNAALLTGGYGTTAPVLRVLLPTSRHYVALRGLTLQSVQLDVAVNGLQKTLVMDNDLGQLNPNKPFLPFGPVPTADATLYVDCPETTGKALSSLTVHVPSWVGKPSAAAWDAYYAAYTPTATPGTNERYARYAEANILATLSVQNRGLTVTDQEISLFTDLTTDAGLTITPASTGEKTRSTPVSFLEKLYKYKSYELQGTEFIKYSPQSVDSIGYELATSTPTTAVGERLLTLRLSQDLGQSAYPALLTAAAATQGPTGAHLPIPNPPYAPVARALSLDYQASSGEVLLTADSDFAQRPVQLFHQGVFGQAEEHPALKQALEFIEPASRDAAYLLPQQARGGTFLLGLRDVGPLESVSVLFQVAEGSANAERDPAYLAWSVLSQNQWYPLTGDHAPVDATDHLLTSGIITFALPAETRLDNTLLEPGLVWLKGELQTTASSALAQPEPAPSDSVARLVALHPQAVLTRFFDHGTDPGHYAQALPAGTIKKVRKGAAGVKAVQQPYPSFGGQPAESDATFYTRVSERLRHKERAVTIWDYEHLVLEHFPGLYKVQCLNHTRVVDATTLLEKAPGYVTLVTVPNLRNAYAANPLTPKVAPRTLAAVEAFAQARAGQLVQVKAVNPFYEAVQVGGTVHLRPGYPVATYQKQLQQDLRAYLSPWAYDAAAELAFGGTLHKSTVLAFLEHLPYVDFITDLTLMSLRDGTDQETLLASSAWSVLVSAPDHAFQVYAFQVA